MPFEQVIRPVFVFVAAVVLVVIGVGIGFYIANVCHRCPGDQPR